MLHSFISIFHFKSGLLKKLTLNNNLTMLNTIFFQLCQITAHLRNSMNKGMCCFSPEDTIFLLNKWDTIEHDKRKDMFFESTKTKIRNIWKEIDERHILKFSAIKVCMEYVLVFIDCKRLFLVVFLYCRLFLNCVCVGVGGGGC